MKEIPLSIQIYKVVIEAQHGINSTKIAQKLKKLPASISRELTKMQKQGFLKYEFRATENNKAPEKIFYPSMRYAYQNLFPNITEKEFMVIDDFFFNTPNMRKALIKTHQYDNIGLDVTRTQLMFQKVMMDQNIHAKILNSPEEMKKMMEVDKIFRKHMKTFSI